VATPWALATASFVFYGTGALLAMALTFLPHEPGARIVVIRALAVVALLVGPLLLLRREGLPGWMYPAINLIGTTVVAWMVLLSAGGSMAQGLAAEFCFVPLHSFVFFRTRVALLLQLHGTVLVAVLCWPLHLLPIPAALGTSSISVVSAVVTVRLLRIAADLERDSVTGLPNHQGMTQILAASLVDAAHRGQPLTLGHLSLDRFRRHPGVIAGRSEHVLRTVADGWSALLPPRAALAHLGAGVYAVCLPGLDPLTATQIIETLRSSVPAGTTASAGLAESEPGDTPQSLLARADASTFRAQRAGGDRLDPDVGSAVTAGDLRRALADGHLEVLFQPIVDLGTGRIIGAEALSRWRHDTLGSISPVTFVPIAEASGAIVDLGRYVMERACGSVVRADPDGQILTKITVNASAIELEEPDYVDTVLGILARTGLAPDRLTIEVTESTLLPDGDAVAALSALREYGVRIAIDDFGTGYSSLDRLSHLPVDVLKIDKSFVSDVASSMSLAIVSAIISLAHALHVQVVAEGIETGFQADAVRSHGCDQGQGWLYGAAMPIDQITETRILNAAAATTDG
jgi:EAL domain-containing protein (putative c-di-GMP-specific phosphodiesterase class I)/GGDEF domain-containing protein